MRRHTVKEVRMWMKTLEENRYKKTYNSDCRRVAWFVNNNLSEDYESMPISMRKKWSKAQYGRERYLAKEFLKSKRSESKLRESIRTIISQLIIEGKSRQLQIPIMDKLKVDKILKKNRLKIRKDYDIGVGKGATFILDVDQKVLNKILDVFVSNRIRVNEI